ncbi:unnamed protein product [Arabidopsis thaliana]|uniref:F-box domain-containing protein n=1 Tax=Arabidopsis thaliana TaxID=3702 RepID=A0A654G772_ARATH|nr:unnamed protein product [Arabidopsis thaliana]
MNGEENSDSIPIDLILEILSRLPAKSITRFHCVSKLWGSMLCRPYFNELFLTISSARPRLLFAFSKHGEWRFFSSPQPQNPYGKSSFVATADFHTKFSQNLNICNYTSGLVYFSAMWITKADVICNPSTGHYAMLPKLLLTYGETRSFFLFDPVGKQFKVLLMNKINNNETKDIHILTLGTRKVRWRKIQQCPLIHIVSHEWICINGALYYIAYNIDDFLGYIVCFDVRSEKFKCLNLNQDCFSERSTKLIYYKGKLGVVNLKYAHGGGFPLKLCMWVLEDVEKQEWTTSVYTLRDEDRVVKVYYDLFIVGITATGEIVLAKKKVCKPFYVFYFNLERNTLLSVEIQGFGEYQSCCSVHAFVDHVEDLNVYAFVEHMKKTYEYDATSISPPEQKL